MGRLIERRSVLGAPIAPVDYESAMAVMDDLIARGQGGYVVAAAVHVVMVARDDPATAAALAEATLVVPDGMPLVWAANLLGAELADRVYGPELMARYCARAAERGYRVFLYGGRSQRDVIELADRLRARYTGLDICGAHAPKDRLLDESRMRQAQESIDAAQADLVWVGLGAPWQERWMHAMRPRLKAPVLVGVGAAFDFHAGRVEQAPAWMQKRGLEWLFRFSREPRRLAGRYLRYNPRFVAAFARQYLGERLRERRPKSAR